MKKLFFTALALSMALAGKAQLVEVAQVSRVALPEGVAGEVSTISPDGSFAVVGELGGHTLYKVDIASGAASVLTTNGTPTHVTISPDSRNIVFRTHTVDRNNLRYTGLSYVDAQGTERQLVKPSRQLNAGVTIAQGGITTVENGRARAKSFNGSKVTAMPVASINYGHLDITVNGKTTTIDPQGRGSYLWPSISPDGTKVVYTLSGSGTYVCNIDGSDARYIGHTQAPRWMGNNMIVSMQSQDNGQQFTASKVLVSNLDGVSQVISTPEHIAMYPSATADGLKVAYSTPAGELYVVTLK
ncbi:MAG: hypothetical protein NC405_07025 [Odoribacter sp.]|nr:hypothetical protein [Odoribacter sp.]